MKAFVNEACIGCGLCAGVCPEVFHMKDDGLAEATEGAVAAELEGKTREAAEGCPVSAIEIEE